MTGTRFFIVLCLVVLTIPTTAVLADETICLACDHSSNGGCGASPWPDFGGLRCENRCLTWCFNGACNSACYCATSGSCAILPPSVVEVDDFVERALPNPSPALRSQLEAFTEISDDLRGVLLLINDRLATDYQGTFSHQALGQDETRVTYRYTASVRRLDSDSHEISIEIHDHPTVRALSFLIYERGEAASLEIDRRDWRRLQVFHFHP